MKCCDKPCPINAWESGKFGLKCTNCGTFKG